MSDAADARLAAGGDQAAFERLYRRHVPRIHNLARRMMGLDEADEATQDAFVRAWEKLGTFRAEAAFGTWLHRLAINVFLGRRAKEGKRVDRILSDETALDRMSGRTDHPEFAMDFETAIGRLPRGAREVFVLHDVEGFKHREIAELLEVTVGTSKAQLHRARTMLRRHLDA
jgi:RNA polymerase sigma-70 factor (ECF subfamily)